MHFWDKLCFECQRIKFQWKNDQNFQGRWSWPPLPYGQPDRKKSVFLRLALQKLASYFITRFHPPSTWSDWRPALLHHTLHVDTSSQSQPQLIKDRSQPSIIQYCEQSRYQKVLIDHQDMFEILSSLLPGWVWSWLHYLGLCNKTGRLVTTCSWQIKYSLAYLTIS